MNFFKIVSLIIGCFIVLGCSTVGKERLDEYIINKSLTKASFEFDCPSEEIDIKRLDATTFGVSGCGYRSTYVLIDPSCKPNNILGEKYLDKFCQILSDTVYKQNK